MIENRDSWFVNRDNREKNLPRLPRATRHDYGFTLIELSIVLVIIGLIVGGVLVGRDLISAAEIRSQISQIEKYNTAVRTFQGKYGFLPGDMPDPQSTQFGFIARGTGKGMGDGDGVLKGLSNALAGCGFCGGGGGEVAVFWVDLSKAGLIDRNFTTATETANAASVVSGANIGLYLPAAKIGNGNYVEVWSGGPAVGNILNGSDDGGNGFNYYSLSAVSQIAYGGGYATVASPGLSVQQAYNLDKKIDDGLPQSGNVTANYIDALHSPYNNWVPTWASGGGAIGANSGAPTYGATTTATPGSSTTCYDNAGGSGAMQYSILQNNGSNINCGLSFKFN